MNRSGTRKCFLNTINFEYGRVTLFCEKGNEISGSIKKEIS
jgi:hypothetical protein